MKIAVDIGHNCIHDYGSQGIGNEDSMVKATGEILIEKLKSSGFETLMVTPASTGSLFESLYQRAYQANSWGADFFLSLHGNSGGGTGSEIWTGSEAGMEAAEKILYNLGKLGFMNRGIKQQGIDGKNIYVLKYTKMPAILVEGCFVDSQEDMELFDAEKMADAILKGIESAYKEDTINMNLQNNLNMLGIRDTEGNSLNADGIIGIKTKRAVANFQKLMGLKQDGIPGRNTSYALDQILKRPICTLNSGCFYAVRYIQYKIRVEIDGLYGRETAAAVLNFQKNSGIFTDGIVGKATWDKILN